MNAEMTRIPAVDVYESESELLVLADLPGVAQDGVSVELERGELRLEGSRTDGGSYSRRFTVPDGINAAEVTGEIKDGVLVVRMPKATEIRPRRVPVTAR